MPITIEDDHYEFDLRVNTSAAETVDVDFNLFLEVRNVLVIFPVKFPIEVLEAGNADNRTDSQPAVLTR